MRTIRPCPARCQAMLWGMPSASTLELVHVLRVIRFVGCSVVSLLHAYNNGSKVITAPLQQPQVLGNITNGACLRAHFSNVLQEWFSH